MTSYLEILDRAMVSQPLTPASAKEAKKGLLPEVTLGRVQTALDPFADLPPNDPAYRAEWRRWFHLLVRHKASARPTYTGDSNALGHRSLEEAHALAYGEAQCLWHERYGQRPDPHLCAGCNMPIGRSNLIALPDGAAVHDDAGLRCLTRYGNRWRTAAENALQRIGIEADRHEAAEAFPYSEKK